MFDRIAEAWTRPKLLMSITDELLVTASILVPIIVISAIVVGLMYWREKRR